MDKGTENKVLRANVKNVWLKDRHTLDPANIRRERGKIKKEAEELGLTEEEFTSVVVPIIEEILDEAKEAFRDLAKPKNKK
ncbi:MAG: hypothetical protein WCO03_02290 [bacterium]